MKRVISQFIRLNIWLTLYYNRYSAYISPLRSLFFGNIKVESRSRHPFIINPRGRLFFNRSWTGRHPFPFYLTIEKNASIFCEGNFSFYEGGHIGLSSGAKLELGSGYANRNVNISCRKKIVIGHDVAIGPNVVIRDSDDHKIHLHITKNISDEIIIGDHVWIGTNAIILKGVVIGSGSVVAAGAVVTKSIPPKSLVSGIPAKVIMSDIIWK